jgi:threonine aldolase
MNHVFNSTALNMSYVSDNVAGASPEIIDALAQCNTGQVNPYGNDDGTARIEKKLSDIFERPVSVFLVNSGSAANALGLSVLTPPWGHVLCHPDSHIYNDECAAPEVFNPGSKLITVAGESTKISPARLREKLTHKLGDVHSTQPATLSITQATETGSVYNLDELQVLKDICRSSNLKMQMDGARFANALVSLNCTPAEMSWKSGIDILSFGATKNGALSAEAVILFDQGMATEMGYRRKRSGHLTSKMRFLSAQIDAYLSDDLWLKNAAQANNMAKRLEQGLAGIHGIELLGETQTNIIFCKMSAKTIDHLYGQGFTFYANRWGKDIVRLVTSFATTEQDVDALIRAAKNSSA